MPDRAAAPDSRQLTEHGLNRRQLSFTNAAVRRIITDYTKEAGLRNLEREIGAVCRKAAVEVAEERPRRPNVTVSGVVERLGPRRHYSEELLTRDRLGVATGLAWTAAGGDLLFIEVLAVAGTGKLVLTGQLGDVMKESAQAAVSFARTHSAGHGLDSTFFGKHDLHVTFPPDRSPRTVLPPASPSPRPSSPFSSNEPSTGGSR